MGILSFFTLSLQAFSLAYVAYNVLTATHSLSSYYFALSSFSGLIYDSASNTVRVTPEFTPEMLAQQGLQKVVALPSWDDVAKDFYSLDQTSIEILPGSIIGFYPEADDNLTSRSGDSIVLLDPINKCAWHFVCESPVILDINGHRWGFSYSDSDRRTLIMSPPVHTRFVSSFEHLVLSWEKAKLIRDVTKIPLSTVAVGQGGVVNP